MTTAPARPPLAQRPGAADDPFGWVAADLAERAAAGLTRRLRPRRADSTVLDLAGNDYLGLARHPAVVGAAADALARWGVGSTGSRLVSGSTTEHADLEAALAAHLRAPAALVFATGYAANLAAVTALAGPGTLVVSDARNHASLVDACRLSRARVVVAPSGDLDAVAAALAGRAEQRALVVSDAVFSADGDAADVVGLHRVAARHGAGLLVDEAHAVGVVGVDGRGAVEAAGLAGSRRIVRTLVLSKALGAQGGALVGPAPVISHVVNTGRTFIFDTGLAPALAAAARAALGLVTPDRVAALHTRAADLAALADACWPGSGAAAGPAVPPVGAVVPVVLGSPERALAAAEVCARHGVAVGVFRPPSVPAATSRLRITARATLTTADLQRAGAALRAAADAER